MTTATKEWITVDVRGVKCPKCGHVNNMPYECLPRGDGWDTIPCDGWGCTATIEFRGWQNGPEVDYHSRLPAKARAALGETK